MTAYQDVHGRVARTVCDADRLPAGVIGRRYGNARRNAARRLAIVTVAACITGGCAAKKKEAWTAAPLVQWEHLSTQSFDVPTEGFQVMASLPTQGLFPANIAVCRVAIDGPESAAAGLGGRDRGLVLRRDPRNEFLQWNRAFDDQMAISSVFPLAQRDLGGGQATPNLIISAMQALGARLGLVYAVNELSAQETEMIGVLYETAGYRPLATFRSLAASTKIRESSLSSERRDPFDTESVALVRQIFESQIYACVRELIANDDPPAIESTEGWLPPPQLRNAMWPPAPGAPDS